MKSLKELNNDVIANDTLLSQKEAEQVRQAVIQQAEASLNMRGVLPTRRVNEGTQTWTYREIEDDNGEAEVVVKGGDYPVIKMAKSESSISVPKVGNAFDLYREDILSARMNGNSLPTQAATRASRLTSEKENDLILNGDSDWSIDGLMDKVNATVSGSITGGWEGSNATVKKIQEDIHSAFDQLPDGLYGAQKTLVLNRTEFQALTVVDDNVGGRTALDVLQQEFDVITWDVDVPADSALVYAGGADVAEYVLVEEINTVGLDDGDDDTQRYKTRFRGAPVVYQSEGLIKMDSI
jgi:hypothetical protein